MKFNILISSAGRRVALLRIVRRTLESMGLEGQVIAVDRSRLSAAYHDADKAFTVPACTATEFIPEVMDICRKHEVRLVIPTIDTELQTYSAAKDLFEEYGTRVAVSSEETILIGANKEETYNWLKRNGFPTVYQAKPEEVINVLPENNFPMIVKPRMGSASIGVCKVNNIEELRIATRGGDYIVQSIAPGIEHTVDVFVDGHGCCRCAIPRRRYEVRAGEVSKGMTVRIPVLMDLARKIAEMLPGAYGVLNIQMFWESKNELINVIEINPRFGGGFPLSWKAGGDYLRWLIEDVLGLPSTARYNNWRSGLVMLRYDDAIYIDKRTAGIETL